MAPAPTTQRVCVAIDALAAGGDGVGRCADGRVIFVPLSAPGDRLRVRVTARRARFLRGEIERVLVPGPGRVEPRCPVFGRCGGCAWQHLDYAVQLDAKRAILRDALLRIGGLALPREAPEIAASPPYGHRLRSRVLVEDGRVGYRRRGSHALCATDRCPILVPELERRLASLARAEAARAAASRRETAAPAGAAPRARHRSEMELLAGRYGVRACRLPARRPSRVPLPLSGAHVAVSPGVFAQANAPLLERLADAVCEAAGDGAHALELHAGAGLFTLGLARRFGRVTAVEGGRAALADLAANLRRAGLANVQRVGEPVERALERAALRRARPDVVVLDPPRAGLPRGAARRLAELRAPRIVYLSCDPATLARDAAILVGCGYALERVEGFDLFPQTAHVEALAVLGARERRDAVTE